MTCCSKKTRNQFNRCIPFFIVGAVLLSIGIPMMLSGIIGGFNYSDLIGYIGGATVFFGLLFLFVWYVITIPNLEKMKLSYDDAENEHYRKSKTKKTKDLLSYNNPAFITDSKSSLYQKTPTSSLMSKASSNEQIETIHEEVISTSSTQVLNSNNCNNNVFLVHDERSRKPENRGSTEQPQVKATTISVERIPDLLRMTPLPK